MLLSVVLFAVLAIKNHFGSGNSLSFSYATLHTPSRNWAANVYERTVLWFEKEAEDLKKEFKEGFEKYKGEIKTLVDGIKEAGDKKASAEEVEKLKGDLTKKTDELQKHFEELELEGKRQKEQGEQKGGKSLMGLAEQGLLKLKEDGKAKGVDMKGLFKSSPAAGKEVEIDLKAVSNMTTGYALTGSNASLLRSFDTEPGVAKDPTTPLFITDLISTGVTDAQTIYWVERVLLEGGAAQVAEAAKFSQISAKYSKFSANAKKTAAFAKITEESVEDVEFILSEINQEIVSGPNSIRVQVENQVLTGDGTGENHKGLFTYATAFALPAGFNLIASPTMYDAASAVVLQVTKANYTPDYMLVNPSDLLNMQLTKDANGNYVIPPFVGPNGMVIAGVRVVANNRIAEGAFLTGDMKRATLFMKRQLTLKFFDQNEDDALYDLRTITGSLRSIFRVKGPDQKAFVKGTFAATIDAIKS